MDEVRQAIAAYLEEAGPESVAVNLAPLSNLMVQHGDALVSVGVDYICSELREIGRASMSPQIFLDEELARRIDAVIVNTGKHYVSAFGDVVAMIGPSGYGQALALLEHEDEDMAAVSAVLLGHRMLVHEQSKGPLKRAYSRGYGTGLKIAAAFALIVLDELGPIKEIAPRYLYPQEAIDAMRAMVRQEDPGAARQQVDRFVYGQIGKDSALQLVMLDIATDGVAMRHNFPDWRRKGRL